MSQFLKNFTDGDKRFRRQSESKHIKDMHVSNGCIHFYYLNWVNQKDRQLKSFIKNLGSMLHDVQST